MDREFASPLDVESLAATALMSPGHFSRRFSAVYGETPYAYLVTRRVERAAALLRAGASVSRTCAEVGYASLGSFSSRFTEVMGETPSAYRAREHPALEGEATCRLMRVTRPVRDRAARDGTAASVSSGEGAGSVASYRAPAPSDRGATRDGQRQHGPRGHR